jgi:hypothetical protein
MLPLSHRTHRGRIGSLVLGLDALLAQFRVALGVVECPRLTEQFAEHVVDEIALGLLFLACVDGTGRDDVSQFLDLLAQVGSVFG